MLKEIEDSQRRETTLWYLGGPSIAIRTGGKLIYIDPFCGPSVNPLWTRRFDPLIDPGKIRAADWVLISHEHRDHCNEATIRAFEERVRPEYFMPYHTLETIRGEFGLEIDPSRVHVVSPGSHFESKGIILEVFPSADITAREAVSFLMALDHGKVFHAGDSLYAPSLFAVLREVAVDVAFLPLGKNPEGWNVYPEEEDFIQMASEIGAKVTVPIHWDLWKESYMDPRPLEKRSQGTEIRMLIRGSKLLLPLKRA